MNHIIIDSVSVAGETDKNRFGRSLLHSDFWHFGHLSFWPWAGTFLHGVTLWVCPDNGHVFRSCHPVANRFVLLKLYNAYTLFRVWIHLLSRTADFLYVHVYVHVRQFYLLIRRHPFSRQRRSDLDLDLIKLSLVQGQSVRWLWSGSGQPFGRL